MQFNEALLSVESKFANYTELVAGLASRRIQHLIVRGAPGIGKTHEAEAVLNREHRKKAVRLRKQSGHMTTLALFNHLYSYRDEDDISLFDDMDDVFRNEHAANILKAATDTREPRRVSWGTTSKLPLASEFRFRGGVMIITNVDMRRLPKLVPLIDRCVYFDMALSPEEITARVIQILMKRYGAHPRVNEVIAWMVANYAAMGPGMSLRAGIKCMELADLTPSWEPLAAATLIPRK